MLFFLWLCSYNSIPVREVLGSKGLSLDQSCPIYRSHLESRDHLLKECSFSVSFWNQLGPPSSLYSSFGLPFQEWIHANCTSSLDSRHHHIPWSLLFLFGIWFLWINRNCVTHQAKQANPSLSKECIAKAWEFPFLTALNIGSAPKSKTNTRCVKPALHWLKLNNDASILVNDAGAGRLIRDSDGIWVQGFSRKISTSSVLMVELWALRDGLHMAKNLNIQKLIINVDSIEVVNLITFNCIINRLMQPLVAECKAIL